MIFHFDLMKMKENSCHMYIFIVFEKVSFRFMVSLMQTVFGSLVPLQAGMETKTLNVLSKRLSLVRF